MAKTPFLNRNWIRTYALKDSDGNPQGIFSHPTLNEDVWMPVQDLVKDLEPHFLIRTAQIHFEDKYLHLMQELRKGDLGDYEYKAKLVRSSNVGDIHVYITYDNVLFGVIEMLTSQAGKIMAILKGHKTTFGA